VSFLVLASEIGGTALALQFATGINYRLWAAPIAILGWLLLWRGTFGVVEQGTALLGLTALVFAVALVALHPSWLALVRHIAPSVPTHNVANYWYLAVSIIGASISPYLVYFYSSGAIEDKWDISYVRLNRVVASVGNVFGGGLAVAVLAVAALVLGPRHIRVEQFGDIRQLLTPPLGVAGFVLLVCTLFITCFGATVEITLAIAYLLAQGFGWAWSEDAEPGDNARFALTYTANIALAAVPIVAGVDPLALTNFSALLTAASLPVSVIPLVVLMNDRDVLHRFRNGWVSNLALGALSLLSIAVLIAAVPLAITGSH
jgi:Mn2+/Fe2+ NRAMP family transporter